MKNYLKNLPKPFLVLAPMYDVTDTVFRQVISRISPPDFTMSEFVNVDGLASSGRKKLLPKIVLSDAEKPIIYQFWGKKPENYRKIIDSVMDGSLINEANALAGQPKADISQKIIGVDINMGCPDKAVLKNGCCGALIKDHKKAGEIIEASRKGLKDRGTLSIKTRIGFAQYDKNWIEFLLGQNLDMLSIHLRTVREMSKVPAHFEYLEEIIKLRDKIAPQTLIVANGDIKDAEHAKSLHEKYGIDGAMIGRGVFQNPFSITAPEKWEMLTPTERVRLYEKHVSLFKDTWRGNERPIVTLNKFCKIYINGFEGSKDARESLMNSPDSGELLKNLKILKKEYTA